VVGELSPPVEAAIGRVVKQVREIVDRELSAS
jgi:hypothetical protein